MLPRTSRKTSCRINLRFLMNAFTFKRIHQSSAVSGDRSMHKSDAPSAQNEDLPHRIKPNIFESSKMCNQCDQMKDTNTDIKINETVLQTSTFYGITFSYRTDQYHISVTHNGYCKNYFTNTTYIIFRKCSYLCFLINLMLKECPMRNMMFLSHSPTNSHNRFTKCT